MKNRSVIISIAVALAAGWMGCQKEQEINDLSVTPEVSERGPVNPPQEIIKGAWEIVSYQVNKKDKTGMFKNYVFKFYSNGVLKAFSDMNGVTGEWKYAASDNPNGLMIIFKWGTTFAELNTDWRIALLNSERLVLKQEHDGENRLLEFKKVVIP